jgi:hypothetical protein
VLALPLLRRDQAIRSRRFGYLKAFDWFRSFRAGGLICETDKALARGQSSGNWIDGSVARLATLVRDFGKAWGGSDLMSLRPPFSLIRDKHRVTVIPTLNHVKCHSRQNQRAILAIIWQVHRHCPAFYRNSAMECTASIYP